MQKNSPTKPARFGRDGFAPFANIAISLAPGRRGTEAAGTPFSSGGPAIRRLTSFVALGALLFAGLSIATSDDVALANGGCSLTGDGDENTPWQVTDQDDLEIVGVGDCTLAGHYVQTGNITLTGQHTPLARSSAFTGVFDGGGYSITGLTMGTTGTPFPDHYVGLFGRSDGATFTDIHLKDVSILASDNYVGGIVGLAQDTMIELSSVSGTSQITTLGEWTGGLVGRLVGSASTPPYLAAIEQSFSSANVTGADLVGGLVGRTEFVSIRYSYASGDVVGGYAVGGLIGGAADNSEIFDSYALGDVESIDTYAGASGLVTFWDNMLVENSYSAGRVFGPENVDADSVRGLIFDDGATITARNSFWDLQTSGQAVSDGGTGKNTAEMQSLATFNNTATVGLDESWSIVAGWAAFDPPTSVWGICPDNYPYLLWQFDSDPCDGDGGGGGDDGGGGNTDSTSPGTASPKTDVSGETTVGLAATGVNSSLSIGAASLAALLVLMGVTLMVARRPTEGSIS